MISKIVFSLILGGGVFTGWLWSALLAEEPRDIRGALVLAAIAAVLAYRSRITDVVER